MPWILGAFLANSAAGTLTLNWLAELSMGKTILKFFLSVLDARIAQVNCMPEVHLPLKSPWILLFFF